MQSTFDPLAIRPGTAMMILGQRKSGKTTVLNFVVSRLRRAGRVPPEATTILGNPKGDFFDSPDTIALGQQLNQLRERLRSRNCKRLPKTEELLIIHDDAMVYLQKDAVLEQLVFSSAKTQLTIILEVNYLSPHSDLLHGMDLLLAGRLFKAERNTIVSTCFGVPDDMTTPWGQAAFVFDALDLADNRYAGRLATEVVKAPAPDPPAFQPKSLKPGSVVLLTGRRRCGMSTLMMHLLSTLRPLYTGEHMILNGGSIDPKSFDRDARRDVLKRLQGLEMRLSTMSFTDAKEHPSLLVIGLSVLPLVAATARDDLYRLVRDAHLYHLTILMVSQTLMAVPPNIRDIVTHRILGDQNTHELKHQRRRLGALVDEAPWDLNKHQFHVFDVADEDNGRYVGRLVAPAPPSLSVPFAMYPDDPEPTGYLVRRPEPPAHPALKDLWPQTCNLALVLGTDSSSHLVTAQTVFVQLRNRAPPSTPHLTCDLIEDEDAEDRVVNFANRYRHQGPSSPPGVRGIVFLFNVLKMKKWLLPLLKNAKDMGLHFVVAAGRPRVLPPSLRSQIDWLLVHRSALLTKRVFQAMGLHRTSLDSDERAGVKGDEDSGSGFVDVWPLYKNDTSAAVMTAPL